MYGVFKSICSLVEEEGMYLTAIEQFNVNLVANKTNFGSLKLLTHS